MPRRVQRTRKRGETTPQGAVYVGRPTKWGNPIPWKGEWIMWTAVGLGLKGDDKGRRAAAVALHRAWITSTPIVVEPWDTQNDGGSIEFGDGTVRTLADHCQGIALGAAGLFPAPVLPAPPSDFAELRGRDLACWCPLDGPCHADVLLEIANA
jgi:hypothetical protein